MFGGAVGAYTDSRGNAGVRQEVADFIQRRDGYPSNPEHIFLTGGRGVTRWRALSDGVTKRSSQALWAVRGCQLR